MKAIFAAATSSMVTLSGAVNPDFPYKTGVLEGTSAHDSMANTKMVFYTYNSGIAKQVGTVNI